MQYIYIIEGENEQIIENHQQKLSLRISWATIEVSIEDEIKK
jgi:hypothetical protein